MKNDNDIIESLTDEIGLLTQEVNRLYDRIQINLVTAQFQKEQAFKAGYQYGSAGLGEGKVLDAYQAWLERLTSESINETFKTGMEP